MSCAQLPVFDLSFLSSGKHPSTKFFQDLNEACKANGFFQIINHGVPVRLQESILDIAKRFYALPLESKEKLSLSHSLNRLGKIETFHFNVI